MAEPATATRTVSPAPGRGAVLDGEGRVLHVPHGWELLPPGDATLTRRVKADGPHWAVVEQRGRRVFSQGVWAPAETIARRRAELECERQSVGYLQRQLAQGRRRQRQQERYVSEFREALVQILHFAPCYREMAERLAAAVAAHAAPVGSGTVARTQRLALDERAKLALLAWLRHRTSDYDRVQVARTKGARRALRRQIAARSLGLLERYRRGEPIEPASCPLQQALAACPGMPPDRRASQPLPGPGEAVPEPDAPPAAARAATAGRAGEARLPASGAWRATLDGFFTE